MSPAREGAVLLAWRELGGALHRRAIWVACAVALAVSIALVVVPGLLDSSPSAATVALTPSASPVLRSALTSAAAEAGTTVEVVEVADDAAARAAVEQGRVASALLSGPPVVVVARAGDEALGSLLARARQRQATVERLSAAGLSGPVIDQALAAEPPAIEILATGRGERVAAASVASLFTYVLLLAVSNAVASGVASEKAHRVTEVVLAIVPASSILYGKVLAVGVLGLMPLAAASAPLLAKLAVDGSALPPTTAVTIASSAAWFVLGAAFYLFAAAALGALVERQEEAGPAIGAISIALIASYLIAQVAADTPLGAVLALVPLSAPMLEPARLALGVSSPLEVAASLAIEVVAVVVMARIATGVFRRAVVHTGRRLRLREVLRRPAPESAPIP